MRFKVQSTSGRSKGFDEGPFRPALDKLPEALATNLRERDRIRAQRFAANERVAELGTDVATEAARQTDDDAASRAARAGKAIPAPVAVPRLEADRAKAAHAAQAQEAAFVAVTHEVDYLASDLYWGGAEQAAGDLATIRTDIEAKAAKLADAVEAAVDQFAVRDWLQGHPYDTSARTWPCDVVDLERYNLTRKTTTPVDVRTIILAAALACLESPKEN